MAGRRKGLSDRQISALARKPKRYALADPELANLYLRVPPRGPIVFTVIVKQRGEQTWEVVGSSADMNVAEAREKARGIIKRIKSDGPAPTPPQSVAAVAQAWLQRHVDKNQLRSARELRRIVTVYITPIIGDLDFTRLRRSDIVALLDRIEDKHGAHQADATLATLRSVSSWMERRSDDFRSVLTRGMKRVPKAQHQRSRVLSDDELRVVWRNAETAGMLGAMVRLLLLTAQRRAKVYWMRWQDITPDGIWSIPVEAREKGNGGRLVLPPLALAIINAQPHFASSPYVFVQRPGNRTVSAFHDRCGLPDWRIHDLRRTSRSLMSRLGIAYQVAEAVMGHTLPGVSGVYDRHSYEPEKANALARLAR